MNRPIYLGTSASSPRAPNIKLSLCIKTSPTIIFLIRLQAADTTMDKTTRSPPLTSGGLRLLIKWAVTGAAIDLILLSAGGFKCFNSSFSQTHLGVHFKEPPRREFSGRQGKWAGGREGLTGRVSVYSVQLSDRRVRLMSQREEAASGAGGPE